MRTRKRILAVLLVMVMTAAMAVTGCGSGDSGDGSASDKTITVAFWDNNQLAGLKEIADEWSKTSGYKVEFTAPDWGSYWTMLEAGVSGGEMPDVFWMHSNNADKYMAADVLLDLNDYIEEDDAIDMDNYFKGIADLYNMDGVQYAIPKDHDTIAVIYNKKIFDKYGVGYPSEDWTWEDFAAAAQEISDKGKADGVYGTYCNVSSNQDGWYNIIYSYGGEVITPDRKASGLDEPATIEAMKFVAEKILPACPPPDSMASTGGDTMFLSGLVGMICQGSWAVNNFYTADNASDYAWALLPYADVNGNGQCEPSERCSIYNGLGWSISAQSEKADAAWSLISAFTSEEGQKKQSELGITMAAYEGCSDAFAEAFDGMDISPFVDIEEKGTLVFRPYSKSMALWDQDISDALVDVWSNPETMEDTLKQLAVQMNKRIAEE
ncbi:sugar ABC transporter substrate-binding protein [Roseburia hominis]